MIDFTPRNYQSVIIQYMLKHARCAIWAGMGLGKTVSTLTAVQILKMSGEQTDPVLVLAPLRVARSTWPDEAAKWSHLEGLKVVAIVGSAKQREQALMEKDVDVFTMNYENIPWLVERLGVTRWPFSWIVADEGTKLKGYRKRQGTKRAQALAKVAHTKVKRFTELSGTPSPNGLKDLWGQIWFIDAGSRLGRTFTDFTNRWFVKSFDGFSIEPREFAQEQIQKQLKDICISLDAKDYFDLGETIHNVIKVQLPLKAQKAYREMEKEMFTKLEQDGCLHEVESFNAASRTMKCLQLANGAAYVGDESKDWVNVHDEKLKALESVVEEAAGMPVLVAYHFKSDLARLKKHFPQGRQLDSDPQTIRDWNAGKIPVMFAHPASAGHGLNLQDGGNIIAFFAHTWNLEEFQQILERLGAVRQAQAGHDRPVFVHYIVAEGTVDELVMERREKKKTVQEILLEAINERNKR